MWLYHKGTNGRNFRGAATVSPQRRGARRERRRAICRMAWPKGNFRWEDVLHWWPLMDINKYWAFPCPWCHQALLHLVKMTMSSWHSALPINMSLHNISRITYLFSPKIFTSTKETCFNRFIHSLVLPQLTQLLVVAHCFLGDLDIFMAFSWIVLEPFRTPRLRLSVLWTISGKPFLHAYDYKKFLQIICGKLYQKNISERLVGLDVSEMTFEYERCNGAWLDR